MYSETLISLINASFFILVLSSDIFTLCISYGACRTKIPAGSKLIICTVCTSALIASIFLGQLIGYCLSSAIIKSISIITMITFAVTKFFQYFINKLNSIYISTRERRHLFTGFYGCTAEEYRINKHLSYIEADCLSPLNAFCLSFATSLDGISTGFTMQIAGIGYMSIAALSFFITLLCVSAGYQLGKAISKFAELDISLFGGIALIILLSINI